MAHYQLETQQASAVYDPETRIATVAYRGNLSANVTKEVYAWLEDLYREMGAEGFYGQIFDFREVTDFDRTNLVTARKLSTRINSIVDVTQIPVALIVGDFYHEEILRSGMRISPEHQRKHIVWTEDEALRFIQGKHRESEQP